MGFVSKSDAKKYTPQDGDTLKSIAERETKAGNPITWQEIAKYNWGTDDKDEINIFLRDELGARSRDADKNFVISADDEPHGVLLIPTKFQQKGLSFKKTYQVKVKKQAEPPKQFQDCCNIPSVIFDDNKSFIKPSVVDSLKPLQDATSKYSDAKIIIFGHTDKEETDSEDDSKALSERRAKAAYAFITNDPDTWENLYKEEKWGLAVVQELLADAGSQYDPGGVDGKDGPKTQAAVKKYQTDKELTVNGVAGPETRKKLFTEYMSGKHDIKIKPDQFIDPKHMGCGGYNLVDGEEEENALNRRVMFYLFHKDRPPKFPCKEGDTAPCKKQIKEGDARTEKDFHCSFYDSVASKCPNEAAGAGLELRMLYQLDVDAPEAKNDVITLKTQDGSYEHKIKAGDLTEIEEDWVELIFPIKQKAGVFDLIQDPGDGEDPFYVFKGLSYQDLLDEEPDYEHKKDASA